MARIQKHRGMAIGTPLGPDTLLLRGIAGTEELSSLFSYELDLLSEDFAVSLDAIVGQNVTVRIECPKGGTRYINGLVCTFSQSRRVGRLASYQATIVPWLWMLTRTSDCRIFQEKKAPDIIKEVMKDHGFSDIKDQLSGSYRKWDYCVQYRETDYNFVSRLMEQEGIYYYFEHENGKHTLVLCDAPSAHKPFGAYAQISYRPPRQASTDLEHIRDWSYQKAVRPGAYVHDDFDFKNPMKELETNSKDPKGHVGADFEIYDYPGEYIEFGDGQNYARVRMQELGASHEVVAGDSDVRGICTGYKFSLTDYPRQDQCREYLAASVTLNARSDEYDSTDEAGGSFFQCSFTAIPSSVQFRPARTTPKPVIQGVQTAIVVGPKGEEIYTDKYGQIKVQFHWDRRSKADETSSCWIRVTQTWAGKKWGAIHVPRIGQEVIVDFLEGDPDRPIIVGTVYNGQEMPPYTLPKEKTRSGTKTNSSKGGGGYNEFSMDDTKGKEQIRVHAEKDKDEYVKNDSREWIGRNRHLIVKKSQFEKVEKHKQLMVTGDQIEEIKGDVHLTVSGSKYSKIGSFYHIEAGWEHCLKTKFVQVHADTCLGLYVGSSCIEMHTGFIAITAPMVYINSQPFYDPGSRVEAPDGPEQPDEAKKDVKGEVDKPPKKPKPPKPPTYASQATVGARSAAGSQADSQAGSQAGSQASSQASTMSRAAESGAPFCEVCQEQGGGQSAGPAGPGPGGAGLDGKGDNAGAGPSGPAPGGEDWKSQEVEGTGPSGYPGQAEGTTGGGQTAGPPGPDAGVEPWGGGGGKGSPAGGGPPGAMGGKGDQKQKYKEKEPPGGGSSAPGSGDSDEVDGGEDIVM